MSEQPNGFESLLDSVSDGRPVDWDAAEARTPEGGARGRVHALREVARIADFSRHAQRTNEDAHGTATADEPQRWGSLMLLQRIGAGATGEVWRAWDPDLEREVALKLLHADSLGALQGDVSPLLEEGRSLARVQHPNVVVVHGTEHHDGRVGLRMEFVRGTTLEQEIIERGALPPDEVARLGAELARAVAAVHAAGLVHRDVKPANVVRDPRGRLVLTDFGLGQRRFLAGDDAKRATGTPMFMSPERLAGDPATDRGDIYGVGVTLWCALAGRHPFEVNTLRELREAVRRGPSPTLHALRPETPQALVEIVERAMAPDPSARFASAVDLASALETLSGTPGPSRPQTNRVLVGAAAILVVAAGILGAWVLQRGRVTERQAPTVAAPPATPAAISYAVEATLVRHRGGASEPLANGDRVRPGDRLSMEFHSTQPTHVYVLNEDERGESYLLFPQPLFDQSNPLPANSSVTLPGTVGGDPKGWTVTSRGGREHFLVVASPEPVAELEAELKRLPAARPGHPIQYAAVSPASVEVLRGVGGVDPLPASDSPRRAGTFDRFRVLANRETGVRGTWVRQITLENPLR